MPPSTRHGSPAWNHYPWWVLVGCLLIAGVVTLSIVSYPSPIEVESGDKYQHTFAYAIMMYWWGMLQPGRRWFWALALPVLGIGLEGLQHLMPERQMDWRDALANTLGVALALMILPTPLGRLLAWMDRQLPDRGNPGPS